LLRTIFLAALITPAFPVVAAGQPDPAWIYEAPRPAPNVEHRSPRRLVEEIGTLGMLTPSSRSAVLARISGDRVYDLSVRYFIGLPSWYGADDLPPIMRAEYD
jgi:hypothetical protein